MIKVIYWDKAFVFVEDVHKDAIERLMGTQRKARIIHLANPTGDVVMGTAIARIEQARYRDYEHMLPKNPRMLEAPKVPELTDEQRASNLKKLAKIREDFGKRIAEKRQKENSNGEQKTNESGVRREVR